MVQGSLSNDKTYREKRRGKGRDAHSAKDGHLSYQDGHVWAMGMCGCDGGACKNQPEAMTIRGLFKSK